MGAKGDGNRAIHPSPLDRLRTSHEPVSLIGDHSPGGEARGTQGASMPAFVATEGSQKWYLGRL